MWPIRIDFWGDEVDRLTEFSVNDQRSTQTLKSVDIHPCREMRPDAAMRRRAASLAESEPWGKEQWERLASGEIFDGMESWWPWLARRPATLLELLPLGAAVVMIEPHRLRDRVGQIHAEEEDLAYALAATWGADASGMPRLHTAFDELSAPEGVPVWTMPVTPGSPDVTVLSADGMGSSPRRLRGQGPAYRRTAGGRLQGGAVRRRRYRGPSARWFAGRLRCAAGRRSGHGRSGIRSGTRRCEAGHTDFQRSHRQETIPPP